MNGKSLHWKIKLPFRGLRQFWQILMEKSREKGQKSELDFKKKHFSLNVFGNKIVDSHFPKAI